MPASYTFVQQTEVSTLAYASPQTTPSITTTLGNLLCAVSFCNKAALGTNVISSSQGDVFTHVIDANNAGAGGSNAVCLHFAVAKGGATTFSQTNASNGLGLAVFEYSSAGALFALLASKMIVVLSGAGTGANNLNTGALGIVGTPDAIVFGFAFDNNKTGACPAGTSPIAFTGRTGVWGTFGAAVLVGTAEDALVSADCSVTFGTTTANHFDQFNVLAAAFSLAVPQSALQILLDDAAHVGGSDALNVGAALDDHTGEGLRQGGVKLKQWAADINSMMANVFDVSQTLGDANLTVTLPTNLRYIYQNATLTANRTIALPSSGLLDGQKFKVVRRAATPGAFTLTISGGAASVVLPANLNGWAHFRAISPTVLVCEAASVALP